MSIAGCTKMCSSVLRSGSGENPAVMLARRSLVEHPFGTLKSWTNSNHFLTKRLSGVSTETSLQISSLQHETSDQLGRNKKDHGVDRRCRIVSSQKKSASIIDW